jgi:CheY-like chemotaxis protein
MIVVDDDSNVRLLLQRAFRAPEFETHTFPSGAAALGHLGEIRPECVVSDVLMPDMDGERLLHAVRAVPGLERVPFIALSAVRSETRIRALLAAGADAFLVKPFPVRDLIEKVRALLARPPAPRPAPEKTDGQASPTRPVVAAPHTLSTAAVRRAPSAARVGAAAARIVVPTAAPRPAPTAAPRPAPPAADRDVHHVEIGPRDPGFGFGRFTRVEVRGRSFVVLTEAVAEPRFTVTTVITEKGVPLRKIETALPHALAREEDRDSIRHQLDLQHDDLLRRLDDLVLDASPRRVVWSDLSRSVDVAVLAWAISAVAQLAETEADKDETGRVGR